MDPTTILIALGLGVLVILWPVVRDRRANARFERAIRAYDAARQARILEGEDAQSIPTAEEELIATGHGYAAGRVKRPPQPDPVAAVRAEPQPSFSSASAPPSDALPSADPFLTRLAEQAKAEGQRRPARKTKHPSPAPVRPLMDPSAGPTPGRRYAMTYAARWGEVSDRTIRFKRCYVKDGEVYIDAFCDLRYEDRTFRADRMLSLTDTRTGERIANPADYFGSAAE